MLPAQESKKNMYNEDNAERCKKCRAIKTPQVHHCRICDRCVFLMDHHCWWTNNCVAYGTIRPFFLFCTYLILLTCVGVPTIIYNFLTKNREYDEGIRGFADFLDM